jgi:hypothetical protein
MADSSEKHKDAHHHHANTTAGTKDDTDARRPVATRDVLPAAGTPRSRATLRTTTTTTGANDSHRPMEGGAAQPRCHVRSETSITDRHRTSSDMTQTGNKATQGIRAVGSSVRA